VMEGIQMFECQVLSQLLEELRLKDETKLSDE